MLTLHAEIYDCHFCFVSFCFHSSIIHLRGERDVEHRMDHRAEHISPYFSHHCMKAYRTECELMLWSSSEAPVTDGVLRQLEIFFLFILNIHKDTTTSEFCWEALHVDAVFCRNLTNILNTNMLHPLLLYFVSYSHCFAKKAFLQMSV